MLEARVRAPTTEQRDVFRARIVLLADEGRSTRSIARAVGTMPRTVSTWRGRFCPRRLDRFGRQAAARPCTEVQQRDRSTHSGGPGAGAAGRLCALDRAIDCGRTGRRARAAGLAFPAGAKDRPRRAQSPGARATIPSLSPRPPMWSGSTWRRPRMRSSSASTKSLRSRRWSAPKAI